MWITIIAFLLIFNLVILTHELGHFYFARRAGVRVEEFGFGWPPRIWGRKVKGTIYSINLIPVGGFVRIYGEGDESSQEREAFVSRPPLQKILVVTGGVLMNFLLGFVVMMVGLGVGMSPLSAPVENYVNDPTRIESRVVVTEVVEGSAAATAGILPGDLILYSSDQVFSEPAEFKNFIQNQSQRPLSLVVRRGQKDLVLEATPIRNSEGQIELGVLIDRSISKVSYVWWQIPWIALQETVRVIGLITLSIIGLLVRIFTTASVPPELAGPVGIAKITADVVQLGWLRVLQFIIFLSLNLGVVNLVPFPALDGGRLAFVLAELVRKGKKIPSRVENIFNAVGFVLIMWLLVVVTYKDILRLI
ncbi:MAG: site-2 protease family protein [Patescibacteria group bacterium]